MKNLIRSIYMGCLLFAFQIPVEAATIEEVLAYCRAQAEADKRLACFDELARAVAEGVVLPTLPSSGTGRWNVTQEISPINDSRNVYTRLEAEDEGYAADSRPALMVRCTESKIDVLVHFDSRLSFEGDIEILSRFDQHPARKDDWGLSTDRKAIFAPHSAFWALKIERAQKLFMRLTPSGESPIDATFNLTGSAKAMRPLRESCGFNVNARDQHGMTALHWTASNNALEVEVAGILVTHGADVNARDQHGMMALHWAAFKNSLEVASLLLTHGADVNAKTAGDVLGGRTALHWTVSNNSLKVAGLLLTHGADIDAKDQHGQTALHSAASNNTLEIASLLLTHGADIDAKDQRGGTALHSAAASNSLEVTNLLLTHGADVNAKAVGAGVTALDLAAAGNSLEVARLLLTHGADANAALRIAISEGHTEMADLLRRHGGKE